MSEQQSAKHPMHEQLSATLSHAEFLQAQFNDMVPRDDPERFEHARSEVLGELAAMNPVRGQLMIIEGPGMHPELYGEPGDGSLHSEPVWGYKRNTEGLHDGFEVVTNPLTGRYQIMHRMLVFEDKQIVSPVETVYKRFHGYFDLDSSFILVNEVDHIFHCQDTGDFEDHFNLVVSRSDELLQLIGSLAFNSLSATEQAQSVDAYIRQVEADTNIRGKYMMLEGQRIWTPKNNEGDGFGVSPQDISKYSITGTCIGLESIGAISTCRRLILEPELDASREVDGISLVLDPDPDTRIGLGLHDKQTIYFPVDQDGVAVERLGERR